MLEIPKKYFSRSVKAINIRTVTLADWLEASLLFDETEIAKNDVVDVLIEEQICDGGAQDLANEIADRGWAEIRLRQSWGGVSPNLSISANRLTFDADWREDPIRAFLVMLSVFQLYPNWAEAHQDFSVQGELFERVAEEICPGLLPGWTTVRAGWSPDNTVNIEMIVADLCERLNTLGSLRLDNWTSDAANDGGLDLVCYREFADAREATPTYFLQCASGTNWRSKIHTPSATAWMKYLDAAVQPSTGIVAPFVISTEEIRHAGLSGQIIVFDRIRLLHAAYENQISLSTPLRQDVIAWVDQRAQDIPTI
ncbi:hypothetical protein [Phaeobacter inhibens]|uniref:hypothetical protein n=1 Tax=Phaeobacter inhibens TaxID=221822 RepID=UPI000C9BF635|nr:hypothetical protein [Phaeobacter inhibens]AUQ54523.1 hypothetical protein PhaeoP92_01846 [Phaeobacter inhibens]AUQ78539.1 hypothetical protein PhaeoP74_01847 [Phaeobacter inhibens]AUR15698.1 hypothetical protein PhaeoP70_01845 [Phaeobacter inhibens]